MRIGFALLVAAAVAAQASAASWPEGRHAAVVLTYDDALTSHLDTAIPALDAAGLKGTFFLSGIGLAQQDIPRWRAAAAHGHELGNHTLFHPCTRATYPAPERYTSESYTPATMLTEIAVMNTMLTAIDGKQQHAFAMPCGQKLAGGVDYLEPLRKSGLARYARGIPDTGGVIDPMYVPSSWFDQNATAAAMIAAVKRAEDAHGLLVFGFHDIGGNRLPVPAAAHAELIAYLKAHQSTIWVATFSEVMGYVVAQKNK